MAGSFSKTFRNFGEGLAEMMSLSGSAESVFKELGSRDEIRAMGTENPGQGHTFTTGSSTRFECQVVGHLYGRLQMGTVVLTVDQWGVAYTTLNGTELGWSEPRNGDWQWRFFIRHKERENIPPDSTLRVAMLAAGWSEW